MKILTVVGNRPQFIKAAAVSGPLRAAHEEVMVHTGQHHDATLSEVFFAELELPRPERELGVAGGTNTSQLARMLAALEPVLAEERPDAVLVYGDTNSTLAGALAAVGTGVPVAHVEAGMRSHDRAMPEERNRVLTDHLAALLLCASEQAAANLRAEGIGGQRAPDTATGVEGAGERPPPGGRARVEVVGDVMVDVALRVQPAARADLHTLAAHGVEPGGYLLLTAHRAGNVDQPARLRALVELVRALPGPVVFPMHPRTRERLRAAGLLAELQAAAGVHVTEPVGYAAAAALVCHARAVLTDSGGVQKEAYLAGVPCVTLRPSTEWVETVRAGWNTLVDLDLPATLAALESTPPAERPALYGDGHAAERCVRAIGALAS